MNFDLTLYGKDEFIPNNNNKTYNILVVDNNMKEEYMNKKFQEFIELKVMKYIGIDFEFNKVSKGLRDVALMQINLEDDNSMIGMIFILNPLILRNTNNLIKLITDISAIKILHGAESLDIPYLFNQLLETKENVDKFCVNFYDTKFLCDYNNIESNKEPTKCNIYSLLQSSDIIDEKILTKLNQIEERMGPVYLIEIDIKTLTTDKKGDLLKYALYDVIYLPDLIKKFLGKSIVYTKIIPETSAIVNKYKRNMENEFNDLAQIINTFNIYFILGDDNMRILLKDIWEMYYYGFIESYMDKLKEINYFKFFFEIITKFIVYFNLIKYFKVYSANNIYLILKTNNIYTTNNFLLLEDIDQYFKWFSMYPELNKLILQFDKMINIEFKSYVGL